MRHLFLLFLYNSKNIGGHVVSAVLVYVQLECYLNVPKLLPNKVV